MTEIDELIKQYRNLQIQKDTQISRKDTDQELNGLIQRRLHLQKIEEKLALEIGRLSVAYRTAEITEQQNAIKERIKLIWLFEDPAKKTYKSPFGTVTLRTTKSLIIDSAKSVIEFLLKNDKCEEGIAKFNIPELRKFADADLLKGTHYDEKQSVSIKLTEVE